MYVSPAVKFVYVAPEPSAGSPPPYHVLLRPIHSFCASKSIANCTVLFATTAVIPVTAVPLFSYWEFDALLFNIHTSVGPLKADVDGSQVEAAIPAEN